MSLRLRHLRRHFSLAASSPPLLHHTVPAPPTTPLSTLDLFSWGRGTFGQLGCGKEGGKEEILFYPPSPVASLRLPASFRLSPVPGRLAPPSTSSAVEVGVSCGLFHSSLLVDGRLWIWGKGQGGQLGFGNDGFWNQNSLFVPTLNPNVEDVRSIALGGVHSTALTRSGEVFSWGDGRFGALGHSVYTGELLPRIINGPWNGKISHLATSVAHTAAITNSGELYTWGRDAGDGRLGLGSGGGPDEGGRLGTPSRVNALPVPVAAVSCGGFFTTALTSEGKLWSWGENLYCELGRGNNTSDWRPKLIASLQDVNVVQIASGAYHSLALTDKGEVFSWGHGWLGQLGHHCIKNQEVPVVIEALAQEHIVYIACGGSSSAAITDTGKLYMWGDARARQLGVPRPPDDEVKFLQLGIQPLPIEVKFPIDDEELGPHHVISVAIGSAHAMALVTRKGN